MISTNKVQSSFLSFFREKKKFREKTTNKREKVTTTTNYNFHSASYPLRISVIQRQYHFNYSFN